MEKLIDALITLIMTVGLMTSGNIVLRETFLWVRKAALTKAAQGLPSLDEATRRMTRPRR